MALPKIPYGGFSPVRLQGRYIRQGLPVRRSLHVARFASVLHAPRCIHLIPVLYRGTLRAEASPFEQPLLLYPRGPRSETGSVVPLHLHLSGPIRPTRRHIPISPLRGLYEMPSLCTLRLGDLRVVPRFRCPSFLTCRPLRPRGDRNRFVPGMRSRHRPSPCYEWLGSPDCPAIRFTQGRLFGASWFAFATACQVARPLCRSDQNLFRPPGLLPPGFRRVGHPSRRWI